MYLLSSKFSNFVCYLQSLLCFYLKVHPLVLLDQSKHSKSPGTLQPFSGCLQHQMEAHQSQATLSNVGMMGRGPGFIVVAQMLMSAFSHVLPSLKIKSTSSEYMQRTNMAAANLWSLKLPSSLRESSVSSCSKKLFINGLAVTKRCPEKNVKL